MTVYKHSDGAGAEVSIAYPGTGEAVVLKADKDGYLTVKDEAIDALLAPYAGRDGHPLTKATKPTKKGAS